MTDFEHRLVLKPTVIEPDVLQVAHDREWILDDIGDTEADVYVNVWFTEDELTEVHYVVDPLVGLSYMTVRGENSDHVADVIRGDCAVDLA